MTETQKAAMQQALEVMTGALVALEELSSPYTSETPCGKELRAAITALRAALAEPEQEPEPVAVAWMFQHDETGRMNYVSNDGLNSPERFIATNPRYALVCALYTTPPTRRQHAEIESLKAECDAMDQLRRAAGDRADGYKLLFDLSDAACKKAEAECDALRAELVERNAARNAYASEFPPDHGGKHNVGIILLNIRNLKSQRDALLKALVDLMPLAEFGAAEQSPPYADEHLLNAAQAAIDAAREWK